MWGLELRVVKKLGFTFRVQGVELRVGAYRVPGYLVAPAPDLSHSVFNVVSQKSAPPQIRQLILHNYHYECKLTDLCTNGLLQSDFMDWGVPRAR